MSGIIGTLPANLQNGTNADASQVMADFNFIVNQVNANGLATAALAAAMLGLPALGSLINIQILTAASGTYTPSTNAQSAIVAGCGAGGAGGGTTATGSSNCSAGSGGGSGSVGAIWIPSGSLTSESYVCGAAGAGVSGANGGNGGESLFGGLLILPGAFGGNVGGVGGGTGNAGNISAGPTGLAGAPSGTGTFLFATEGEAGSAGLVLLNPLGGNGGNSPFGSGGPGSTPGSGLPGQGYGSGGSGSARGASAAASAGLNGAPGLILVFEFAGA